MKYTILGAGGMIGGHLANALTSRGERAWCPRRDDEPELFRRPLGTVYYCIGLTADYRERPFDTVEAHVSLLARLLRDADFERLVYLSSTRLYDTLGAVRAREESMLSLSPLAPRHLFDLSKALGENLCLTVSGGRARVARLACVLDTRIDADGFVPSLLRQCRGRNRISVASSSGSARDYIGIGDVVRLLIAIAHTGRQSLYNVASGINVRNDELFRLIRERTGCEIECAADEGTGAPDIDIDRIRDEFGFAPTLLGELLDGILAGADD